MWVTDWANSSAPQKSVERRKSCPGHRIVSVLPNNSRPGNDLISFARRKSKDGDGHGVASSRRYLGEFNVESRIAKEAGHCFNYSSSNQAHTGRGRPTTVANKLFVSSAQVDLDLGRMASYISRQPNEGDPRR
jgi:hypothetical protein